MSGLQSGVVMSKIAVIFGLALAAGAIAAPAFADTVVYGCKIERRIEGQDQQVYSNTLRADPAMRFRFAIDPAAGKACRLDGMTCAPVFSTLAVTAVDGGLQGAGVRLTDGVPATLTYWPNGKMSFVVTGSANGHSVNSQTLSGVGDCTPTGEKALIR
jgi:hypothetical protein